MTSEQKQRLQNRVNLCNEQIAEITKILGNHGANLKFWKNELSAAQSELIGMQLALNLRCSECG